ncbi:MAG: ion channel [Rhodospirillales bacterium]
MLSAIAFGIVLVGLTILVHYEALRLISGRLLPRLTMVRPRARIMFVIFGVFAAHTVEVYIYAVGYWLMAETGAGVGGVGLAHYDGRPIKDFASLLYFSSVTYTSLGFGDIVPLGGLQLVSGIEALNGLLLIGWSASFTYLCMEKLWPLHRPRRDG